MRLCQSMASDSPSEPSYIGRMNTLMNHQREVNFLVDSGCTGAIMNSKFVFQHKLPWVKRAEPVKVIGADGTPIEGAGVQYTTPLTMRIGHHQEESSWEISQLERGISGYLPIEWLTKHNPEIDWEMGVCFDGEATSANPIVYRPQCEKRYEISSNYCEKLKFGKPRQRPRPMPCEREKDHEIRAGWQSRRCRYRVA
jgi:hypothetical protein